MRSIAFMFFIALAVLFSSNTYAQNDRDMQKEAAIWDQLRTLNPDLLETFKQGTAQMDSGDYKSAAASYQKVIDAVPGFDVAYRRLGTSLSFVGDTSRGVQLLEKAVNLNRSPENLATLAQILVLRDHGQPPPKEAQQRAFALIQEATQKSPKPDAADLYLKAGIAADL